MSLAVIGANDLEGAPLSLRCEGGRIAEAGPDVTAVAGDEVIDAHEMTVMSPLVNAHTHAAMTLFRSWGDDMALMDWLQTMIWPAEAKLTPDDVYWGTRLACIEMIRSGTTTFFDMYWHGGAVARAVDDAGVRATVCAVLFDHMDASAGSELRGTALASLDELAEHSDRVTPSIGPHAIYTVSRESLEWIAETAHERGVAVHIHLSEIRKEVEDALELYGLRPAALLDKVGLLGPMTVVAHGCWLDNDELALLAETGTTVAMVPTSNLKLASGTFPYIAGHAAGVPLGLGSDGTSSNNNLDLFEDLKIMALIQKATAEDPAVLPAHDALAIAQGLRSPLLGGTPLAAGERADFLLTRNDLPETANGDHTANLVYAANGSVVDTTVVDGRVLMRDRVVAGQDEVIAEVRTRAERLTS